MTWNDSASMFMLLVVSMSRCITTKWWMCSWCIIASSLHGKLCEAFDGLGVHLLFARACSSFACTLTSFMCSSIRKKISLHAFLVCPFILFFITSCLIHVLVSAINHWRDNIKCRKLLVYHDAIIFLFQMQVTTTEDKFLEIAQGKFQVGMRASGTIDENCVEVTRRLG